MLQIFNPVIKCNLSLINSVKNHIHARFIKIKILSQLIKGVIQCYMFDCKHFYDIKRAKNRGKQQN